MGYRQLGQLTLLEPQTMQLLPYLREIGVATAGEKVLEIENVPQERGTVIATGGSPLPVQDTSRGASGNLVFRAEIPTVQKTPVMDEGIVTMPSLPIPRKAPPLPIPKKAPSIPSPAPAPLPGMPAPGPRMPAPTDLPTFVKPRLAPTIPAQPKEEPPPPARTEKKSIVKKYWWTPLAALVVGGGYYLAKSRG